MKRFLLPPEIGWPLMVIALLLASVGTGMSIVYFAQSDGGAQVVDRSTAAPVPPTVSGAVQAPAAATAPASQSTGPAEAADPTAATGPTRPTEVNDPPTNR